MPTWQKDELQELMNLNEQSSFPNMLRESQLRLTYLNDEKGGGNEYEKEFR